MKQITKLVLSPPENIKKPGHKHIEWHYLKAEKHLANLQVGYATLGRVSG